MSDQATITLDPAFVVGPVQRRTFGTFVEHLGRCVYSGIHDPGHSTADADGFRGDVVDLVKELGISTVRYPGGNFVSGYRWEDAIGPVESRPRRLDLAWHSTEPNLVGVDEFMRWVAKAGVEPMMAINLGTRGVQEALDILEYCNMPTGTYWADKRAENGHPEPYKIRLWCLGNEMDGPWQTGHKTPEEYGRVAAETARAMRQMDPDIELVACGSSGSGMDTFGSWEHTVLSECYEVVDHVSAHAYYAEHDGDLASFLASAVDMDHFVSSVVATADAVRAAGKHTKRIMISFDEWNVWYQDRAESQPPEGDDWPVAPVLLEDKYSVADAVVVGGLLISLLRNSDRVQAASLAQLVNVIAPIMTEPGGRVWKQTTFYPFALTSQNAKGEVLRLAVDSPKHETKKYGEVDTLDAVATHDKETGEVTIFAINRSAENALSLDVALHAFGDLAVTEAVTYANDDPYWQASVEDPDSVLPQENTSVALADGKLTVELPAVSWSMIKLAQA
ncbi:MAG: alpha-N-arabinofuranosidase [Propionibacteriaceae bacterium]|jgi:alpha-N-arabinofuranosidase|nr:alpha-N-arabinofuranosidase [Propionibacteriaceae bacterium]